MAGVLVLLAMLLAPGSAVASPATIAYAGVRWSSNSVTASIWTMRADGTHRQRLTGTGKWTDTNPAWSPDGRRIAFGRFGERGWRIYVMNASGSGLRALTSTRSLAEAPTWSPDGKRIAFAGMPAKLPMTGSISQQIYVVNVRTRTLRAITHRKTGAGVPAWAPDGKRIAFASPDKLTDNARQDIWTVHPDGSGLRRLIIDADGPAWSPDGARLAFSRNGDIYTANQAGRDLRRVTNTPKAGDTDPSWSADGIAYGSMHRAANPANDDMLIAVSSAAGRLLHTVRDGDPNFWMDSPAWRP